MCWVDAWAAEFDHFYAEFDVGELDDDSRNAELHMSCRHEGLTSSYVWCGGVGLGWRGVWGLDTWI